MLWTLTVFTGPLGATTTTGTGLLTGPRTGRPTRLRAGDIDDLGDGWVSMELQQCGLPPFFFKMGVVRSCGVGKCGVVVSRGDNYIRSISRITCSVVGVFRDRPGRGVGTFVLSGCSGHSSIAPRSVSLYFRSVRTLVGSNELFTGSTFRGSTLSFGGQRNILGTVYLRITRSYGLTYGCYFTNGNRCSKPGNLVDFRAKGETLSFLIRGDNAEGGLRISFFNKRPLLG